MNANLNSSDQSNSSNPTDQSDSTNSDTESPIIQLNGVNPAIIDKGSVYSDLGASVTDNINQNLGYKIKLDDGLEIYPNDLVLDTSVAGEHTITYIAVDQAGNIGTAVRTVSVVDPNVADSSNQTDQTDQSDSSEPPAEEPAPTPQ